MLNYNKFVKKHPRYYEGFKIDTHKKKIFSNVLLALHFIRTRPWVLFNWLSSIWLLTNLQICKSLTDHNVGCPTLGKIYYNKEILVKETPHSYEINS